jgi:hypothetical protein
MRSPKATGPITPADTAWRLCPLLALAKLGLGDRTVTAIRRLLQHASRWPKELERLVAAYERALGLKDRNPFRKTLKRFQSWRSRNVEPHKDALVFLGTNSRPPRLMNTG